MSVRTLNWLKFGGLVVLAFALGLLFAGLLDLPHSSSAQQAGRPAAIQATAAPSIPQARALSDLSDAFAAVAEQVEPSVVFIRSQRTERATHPRVPQGLERFFNGQPRGPQVERGSGSGFVISADGYILTNNHVVEDADKVIVRLSDKREFIAKVVGTDPNTDVAVLKIDAPRLTPAALGNSDASRIGEWVLAIGNPLGDQFTFTVTSGIISGKGRRLAGLLRSNASIADFIQTDAAINPGNSGGPLVSVKGEVIGINSAIASESGYNQGYGFAIPINLARTVMTQLIASGRVQRAALGIMVQDASQNDAQYVGLPDVRGVVVAAFPKEYKSPAEAAGLEQGDVIITIDGKPISYVAQLQQLVGFRKPGEAVKVEVARKGGVRKVFTVRLMEQKDEVRPAAADDSEAPAPDKTESVSMDALGVSVQALTPDVVQELELGQDVRGLLITEVDPNGPAYGQLASPDEGGPDVIQSVEGKPTRSESDLRAALRDAGKGGIVTIRVYNGRAQQSRIERVKLQ
jgi:serine protease Do